MSSVSPDTNERGNSVANSARGIEVSVVMPCLNESETLECCIRKAFACIDEHELSAEVLVADNGSTDGSQEIARRCGARVVDISDKGYGSALRGGIASALGRFIVMADADDSYDFSDFSGFIDKLRDGADLVMGSRFKGRIMPGAMPWKHRWIGNPVLTGIGRVFFHSNASDFHCGLRAFTKDAFERMELVTTGMEFASEMVIKATLRGMRIEEVPVVLYKDGRSRPPHLRSWHDGWRHLRFMLVYSPKWLFLIPGMAYMLIGLFGCAALLPGPLRVGALVLDVHSLLVCSAMLTVGLQLVFFAATARIFAASHGLLPPHRGLDKWRSVFSLERLCLLGLAMFVSGVALMIVAFVSWSKTGFGPLHYAKTLRLVIPATTLVTMGVQVTFGAFLLSVLDLPSRKDHSYQTYSAVTAPSDN